MTYAPSSKDSFYPDRNPLTQGVIRNGEMLELSLFSSSARSIFFQLFSDDGSILLEKIPLMKGKDHRWHASISLPDPELTYNYSIDGQEVVDPYAKGILSSHQWGAPLCLPRCHFTFDHIFDWEDITPPNHRRDELIIYEMHVRGLTKSPSSGILHPGTYLGVIEKLPYLKNLGVTTLELMPIMEFNERDNFFTHPHSGDPLVNYWGYNPKSFFSPMKRYAASNDRLAPIYELKTLIKECHRRGIEVFLDVVYNHASFEMGLDVIDRNAYYILDEKGEHTNYSGCGNTINASSDASLELILASLRYFAEEFHIDGFRFDLAGSLSRGEKGSILTDPPLFESIAADPILSTKKFTGEPWDPGGAYLIGQLGNHMITEWNGPFEQHVRQFINKETPSEHTFSYILQGLPGLYKNKPYAEQIHYITTHDGFSLRDLVSYNEKHNEINGENNHDGSNDNYSYNYGVEGCTQDPEIEKKRQETMKLFHLANLFSLGNVMITMGDEYGLTHEGNNNPYCHDSSINWFDWEKMQQNQDLVAFVTSLCHLRKQFSLHKMKATPLFEKERKVVIQYDKTLITAFNRSDHPFDLTECLEGSWEISLATTQMDSLLLPSHAGCLLVNK